MNFLKFLRRVLREMNIKKKRKVKKNGILTTFAYKISRKKWNKTTKNKPFDIKIQLIIVNNKYTEVKHHLVIDIFLYNFFVLKILTKSRLQKNTKKST